MAFRLGDGYDKNGPRRGRPYHRRVERNEQQNRRTGRMVARVLGIPLYLNASMLVLAVLVTVVYGGYVQGELGLAAPVSYLIGLGFVCCLLASVLLHELGHALTARRYGIGVRGITLELLGGYTEMDRDAPRPRIDALVSLSGPAVSLVLGALAGVGAWLLPDRTVLGQIAFQLAASNILVAVFNSLPGLPLDGGRALRAAVWAVLKDRDRATVVAGWAGRIIAVGTGVLIFTLYRLNLVTLFGLIFILLVVFTLWQGAGQSIRLARMTSRFPLIDLGALAKPVFAVPSGTPLAEAQRQKADGATNSALAVADSAGNLVALVDAHAAARVPADRRPWVPVDTVARNLAGVPALKADLTGEQVVRAVQAYPGAQYLVVSGEDVVGVLDVADLAAVLEPSRGPRRPAPAKERS